MAIMIATQKGGDMTVVPNKKVVRRSGREEYTLQESL